MAVNTNVPPPSTPRATAPPTHAHDPAVATNPESRAVSAPLNAAAGDHRAGPCVVYVVAPPRQRGRTALCTCGWIGRHRSVLRTLAVHDAWTHAAHTGCHPSSPLVVAALPTSDAPALSPSDTGTFSAGP